jgi:hypothetical protein
LVVSSARVCSSPSAAIEEEEDDDDDDCKDGTTNNVTLLDLTIVVNLFFSTAVYTSHFGCG